MTADPHTPPPTADASRTGPSEDGRSGSVLPDVTIVVPTRNRAVLLRRLLGQLVHLDGPLRYEVIVIDEGSTDETPALLDAMARRGLVRTVRHDPPRGLPAARNVGLDMATAPWIAWIDDDDLTSVDRLRLQHEELVASGARWSCAGKVDIDDDLRIIGARSCPTSGGRVLDDLLRFNVLPAAAQGLLVDRSLAIEVGGYDETLLSAEDWEFCIRLAAVAPPHFLDRPAVAYRTGAASMSTNTPRMEREIARVLDKTAALRDQHGVAPDWKALHRSLLNADLMNGRRPAVSRALKVFRAGPSLRDAALVLAVAASPRRMFERAVQRRTAQVPEAWRAEANAWLEQVPANTARLDARLSIPDDDAARA